jgi:undecaprenyl diphosphate synthase
MDGNRRWAAARGLPKSVGHAHGARRVKGIVQACADRGVSYLTVFAFSTENWQRPYEEVVDLLGLLVYFLEREVNDMNANGVRLRVIGDIQRFSPRLQKTIREAQEKTASNTRITLTIAANYGGRWDMLQAVKAWQVSHPDQALDTLDEDALRPYLSTGDAPDPELVIRSAGDSRISNFLLWQMAYSEIYLTDTLWPDFTTGELNDAIAWFSQRDRRFGGSTKLVAP